MSQENVEIVRLAFDAFNRGDFVAAIKVADPEAELDFSRALGPYRGVYRLDQVRGFFDDFTGTFSAVRAEPTEYLVAGEHVVVPLTIHLEGRDGIETTARGAQVWTIRDGLVVRVCIYQERQEALEAAGLSE
jgi:ketosteroid isomerase-like protein